MKFHNKKLLTTVTAVALAFAVGACSSSSDDDDEVAAAPPPVTVDPAPEPTGPTNDQVAASQTALDMYSAAMLVHTVAQTAYGADMSLANATALQTAATALHAAATAAQAAIAAGASDAQKAAFGDTAVADATAAVMSAADAIALVHAVADAITLANAIAASQTALNAYMAAQTAHTTAKDAYDADMSVANATALQTAATALEAAATAAHTAIAAGASDAQKAAFGDTAVADATAAVMSAGDSVTLANAVVASQVALDAYLVTQTAHTTARAAYIADASVANATALQTAATALQAAATAAKTAIAAGANDAQKAAFGDTAVADAQAAVTEAATFVIAARLAADEVASALAQIQEDAATAATDAGTAAIAAKVASEAANTARENLATMQTGLKSGDLAHASYTHANAAADAATEAQTASDNAAAATDAAKATRYLVMAEAARDNAVTAQGMAETQSEAVVTATMAELMIVGTVKTVGGTSIDADAGSSLVTTGEGAAEQTVHTGLIKSMNPKTTGDATDAAMGVEEIEATPAVELKAPVAGAVARTFPIGKVVDSADDTARLLIINQYAGTKTVKVYVGVSDTLVVTRGSDGTLTDTDSVVYTLRSAGMYYLASALNDANAVVAEDAKPKQVYSYRFNITPNADVATYETRYVVLGATSTVEATADAPALTTVTYNRVNIHVALDHDGDDASDVANGTLPRNFEVTAKIPEATEYNHIHFGVWAALEAPAKDGTQKLSDLGIGFVQNFSGEGLTSIGGGSDDMPNGGEATYNGNWVAAVQEADDDGNGDITLTNGIASLDANFDKATIDVDLMGLATLKGAIDTNTFSGTKATVGGNEHSLTAAAMFTGSFSGGFYGTRAAEAGGIFDFTSEDQEDGAFRGAFGGKK